MILNRLSDRRLGTGINTNKVDAVFVWGYNKKTFIFSGSQYWRFWEQTGEVEGDYPRPIGEHAWGGVPVNINAAFMWSNNRNQIASYFMEFFQFSVPLSEHTYFFKDKCFWELDDKTMSVKSEPKPFAPFWFEWMLCRTDHKCVDRDSDVQSSSQTVFVSIKLLLVINVLIFCYFSTFYKTFLTREINL